MLALRGWLRDCLQPVIVSKYIWLKFTYSFNRAPSPWEHGNKMQVIGEKRSKEATWNHINIT